MHKLTNKQKIWLYEQAALCGISNILADKVISAYSTPNRHYHDISHLIDVLQEAAKSIEMISNSEMASLRLALWFHDTIQERPAFSFLSNEELSAAWLSREGFGHVQPEILNLAVRLIELTGKHTKTIESYTNVEAIMISCDLSILGKDTDSYKKYSCGVKQEYSYIPDDIFVQERIKVLSSLLSKANNCTLFPASMWHQLYNAKAIKNMTTEIDYLRQRVY